MIISIAGLIGSGKSSIVKCLGMLGCAIRTEPWERNLVLKHFLKSEESMKDLGFVAQVDFLNDRKIDMDSLQAEILVTGQVGVLDSSVTADACFAHFLSSEWHPVEFAVYQKLARTWRAVSNLIPDITFFISLPPEECLRRIQKRIKEEPGREGEKIYTLDYLQRLQKSYMLNLSQLGRQVVILSPDSPNRYEKLYDSPMVNARSILDHVLNL